MPLALDTNETADFSLATDRDKPEAERPTFVFHHLSRRELRKVQDLRRRAEAEDDDEKCEALLDEAIRIGLVSWRNMRDRDGKEIPYIADALDDVVAGHEKWLIVYGYPAALVMEAVKKKPPSDSLSPTNTGNSAPAAAAASA